MHLFLECSFTLYKGFLHVFTITLDQPILCQDPHACCAVVVLLTNSDSTKLKLDTCQVS